MNTSNPRRGPRVSPWPHDLDLAPQLITISVAHAALAAIQLALERAHPILAILHGDGAPLALTDAEHAGALILHDVDVLAQLLDDYAAVVCQHHSDADPLASLF